MTDRQLINRAADGNRVAIDSDRLDRQTPENLERIRIAAEDEQEPERWDGGMI